MKKVLVTICAMAAVLACTKTEVTFDEPGEISFAPVSRYATKAAVGTGDSFTQSFYVFANTNTENVPYFSNVLFGYTDNDGIFLGNPSQFWPNATPLKFAGVTETGNIGTSATVSMTGFSSISITGYTQPSTFTTDVANDLMWFYADNNDGGYGKQTNAIAPTMNHACSWITFNVKVDAKLADVQDGQTTAYWRNITLKEVAFESLASTGTATITFEPVAPATNVVWKDQSTTTASHVVYTGNGSLSSTTALVAESITNNIVVIPQTPTTVSVTYSYTTPAGGTVEETVTGVSLNYNGTDAAWAPGVHYTYNLTIGADEIKIAPTVGDWTPGTGSGLSQDVK